jgi:ATPase subunit of ABC transporter with duplicated ATPase domains
VEILRALEEGLLVFPGCAIVVSHDVADGYFDHVATIQLLVQACLRGRFLR